MKYLTELFEKAKQSGSFTIVYAEEDGTIVYASVWNRVLTEEEMKAVKEGLQGMTYDQLLEKKP